MKLTALGSEHPPVGRLLDECMAEPVRGLGDLPHLGYQPCRAQARNRRLKFAVDICDRTEGGKGELSAQHRRCHDRLALVLA